MEKVQKENDGGLTRQEKQKELSDFCTKHIHDESCPLYSYCEERKEPFACLPTSEIDHLYEDYILKPQCEDRLKEAEKIFGADITTASQSLSPNDIRKAREIADDQEAKADAGKAQISLVPMEIVWAIAWIRMYGNRKYGDPDNWKTVEPQRYRDALMRHLLHYISDPESVDEESGYPHLWHAACNMAFLMHFDYGKETLHDKT